MEIQNHLGIYLRKNSATVVSLGRQERKYNLQDAFNVSNSEQQEQNYAGLIQLIAQTCAERKIQFSEVAVALDCALFMQHNIHSDFDDPKQISQTIMFDTEEALATDVTDTAITFRINSIDETGSELTVFTAKKDLLTDIITAMQANKMDPVTIEPDVVCLSRFLSQSPVPAEDVYPLFALLSLNNIYFILPGPAESPEQSTMRTSLLNPKQDRTELLKRETLITTALLETKQKINRLKLFDSSESLDYNQLTENLNIKTEPVDLPEIVGAEPQTLDDCDDKIGFALAYGTAAALSENTPTIDFRKDFAPFQGRKLQLQKTLKFLSITVTVLLVAVGIYLQAQWFQKNKPIIELQNKLETQYATIMGSPPSKKTNPLRNLQREIVRIENVKSGQLSITGEKAVSAKLTLLLAAFNRCAAQTRLNIDSISITTSNITISGNTSSRKNTLKLRSAIENNNLKILKDSLEKKGGTDNFRITIELKN